MNQRGLLADADQSDRWHTIMAYGDQCGDAGFGCRGLLRFSNPRQSHNGDPLGTAGDAAAPGVDGPADAVRALNGTRHSVAAFRARVESVAGDSPEAVGTLSNRRLVVGGDPAVIDVSTAFRDPDGDRLTFAASSSGVADDGSPVASVNVSNAQVTIVPGAAGLTVVTVTATDTDGSNTAAWQQFQVFVEAPDAVDYDADDDGLIEVRTWPQLDAVRHDANGDGSPAVAGPYAAAFPDGGLSMGCTGYCRGYELLADLDFDTNGNGLADAGDELWNGGLGWQPIGSAISPFRAVFEGNGHVVGNLYVRDVSDAGLFGRTHSSALIRNVGLRDVDLRGVTVGGLVARNHGTIRGCHVSGRVRGDTSAGLVGVNQGDVAASYSAAQVDGDSNAGGLVGWNLGRIRASHASGAVAGRYGGGLVDVNHGEIEVSYSIGGVSASGGGLVARNEGGTVRDSYWDTDTSGQATSGAGSGRSTKELQAPTGYAGIYAQWNLDVDGDGSNDHPWNFGNATEYPALVVDFDGDGRPSWEEFGDQRGAIPRVRVVTVRGRWLTLARLPQLDGDLTDFGR